MSDAETESPLEKIAEAERTALVALAQLHPVMAALVSVWTKVVPTRRQRRREELLETAARRIAALEGRLDSSRALTEPFADLLEDVMASVSTRRGLDKRAYYAAVLANALIADAPAWDRQERMVAILDELRTSHLTLLAMAVRDLESNPVTSQSVVGPRRGFRVPLPEGMDHDLANRDWRDMVGLGLFEGLRNGGSVGPTAQSVAVENVGDQALFVGTITFFGLEFAAFVGATDQGDT